MTILREKVQELLDQGVIEPSTSAYASPAFLVPKPGGKHRLVIDYRKLNQNIEVESVPLPDLHSALDWFSQALYFTIFDLNSAYHQIPLHKESRPYTAFCVRWNLYQYMRVPMGLAVGAQTLTRLLDTVFQGVKFQYVFNYLDDLLIYSTTLEAVSYTHLDVYKRQVYKIVMLLKRIRAPINLLLLLSLEIEVTSLIQLPNGSPARGLSSTRRPPPGFEQVSRSSR